MVNLISCLMPRPLPQAAATVGFGEFILSFEHRQLCHGNRPVVLSGRAFDLLAVLVNHAGITLDKRFLIQSVWRDRKVDDANLRIHIATLRRVLDLGMQGQRYLINEPGRGYGFVAELHPGPFAPGGGIYAVSAMGQTNLQGHRLPRRRGSPRLSAPRREVRVGTTPAGGDSHYLYRFAEFVFDAHSRELHYRGKRVELGSRALALLHQLLRHAGKAKTDAELIGAVWPTTCVERSNLRVQISALRRALTVAPSGASLVQTEPGRGYRIAVPVRRFHPPGMPSARRGVRGVLLMQLPCCACPGRRTPGSRCPHPWNAAPGGPVISGRYCPGEVIAPRNRYVVPLAIADP